MSLRVATVGWTRNVGVGTGLLLALAVSAQAWAAPVVPGTGRVVENVGDDFEDPDWGYVPQNPKSSSDLDKRRRGPYGRSTNGRWHEGEDRGHPDLVKRVETPAGGLEGSTGSLLIATLRSGIPGRPTVKSQQDDFFMTVKSRVGGYISVSKSPNFVVRVYIPEFEEWEQRNGSSFALRATVRGGKGGGSEPYWPGIFIKYNPPGRNGGEPSAQFIIRSKERGNDYTLPRKITEPGWWTLGMSFSPDGQVHYYASEGIDDLTAEDRLASHYCYGFRARQFRTIFFDVFNRNDGQTWSTGWVIDDPTLYVVDRGQRTANPAPTNRNRQRTRRRR